MMFVFPRELRLPFFGSKKMRKFLFIFIFTIFSSFSFAQDVNPTCRNFYPLCMTGEQCNIISNDPNYRDIYYPPGVFDPVSGGICQKWELQCPLGATALYPKCLCPSGHVLQVGDTYCPSSASSKASQSSQSSSSDSCPNAQVRDANGQCNNSCESPLVLDILSGQ